MGRSGGGGFNPTLVRLRPVQERLEREFLDSFQSHAGSIEACMEIYTIGDGHLTVSIPRWFD